MQIPGLSCTLFSLWRCHSGPTRSRLWVYRIARFAWGNMKWAALISLVVLFSVPCDLSAQTDRATVTGTISDPSGAVVPGVQVVATNSASGLQLQTSTNALGAYSLLNLPIGRYTLATTKEGFADNLLQSCVFREPSLWRLRRCPRYLAGLRKPNLATEDLGLSKTMQFACDACQLRVYFQVFNVFNRHGFAGPNTQIGSAGFGQVLPQDLNGLPGPRVGQLGARFTF